MTLVLGEALNNLKDICDQKKLNETLKDAIELEKSHLDRDTEGNKNKMNFNYTPKSEIKSDSDWSIPLGTPTVLQNLHPFAFKTEQDVLSSFGGRQVPQVPQVQGSVPDLKKRNHRKDKIAKYVRNDNKERPFGCETCFKRFTSQVRITYSMYYVSYRMICIHSVHTNANFCHDWR